MTARPIRVILADDHTITREGIRLLLEQKHRIRVIAQADNGRDAIKLTGKHRPDVVIMDINMPELNGAEATRRITADYPDVRVIALSMYSDKSYVTGMLSAGVSGYLLKSCAFEELEKAVYSVADGQVFMSRKITDFLVKDYINIMSKGEGYTNSTLTSREREVLQLIAEGNKTREIAELINVSVKTVETHRKKIMGKLDMHTIAELTRFALREGITSLDP